MYTEREPAATPSYYSLICKSDSIGGEIKMKDFTTKEEAEKFKKKAERQFLTRKNLYKFRYEVRAV